MSDENDTSVHAGVSVREAEAVPADDHAQDPLRDVLRLRHRVRVGVYLALLAQEPFYYFVVDFSAAQLAAGFLVGALIAFLAIEGAFNQIIKLRKRSAYPNLLLTEIGGVAETSRAAQRGLEVLAGLLGVRVALIGLRGNSGGLLPVARLGLSEERADEILLRSADSVDAAMLVLGPVSETLSPGKPFHEAFGLVPRGVERIVFAPVVALDNAIGVIVLAADGKARDVRDDQLVSDLGMALGLALENLRQRDELREGRERFQRVITGAPLILFALDRDGAYTLLEGRGMDILGTRPEQVLGRSILDVFKGRTEITDAVKRALAGEELVVTANFQEAIFEAHLTPLRDRDGDVAGVIGVAIDITERRLAEDALRASEERLSALVANVPVVLFAIDREGKFTLSEGRALADLGLAPGQVVGMAVRDAYRDSPRIIENVDRALAGEAVADTIELDGMSWETIYSPVRDASGAVISVIGVALNATERRRTEDARRESEELYRTLVETSPDAVILTTAEGVIIKANRPAAALLGVEAPEALDGLNAVDFVDEPDRQRIVGDIESGFASGVIRNIEYVIVRGDGSHVPVEISISAITGPEGEPKAFVTVAHDITERRHVQGALRESEEKYRDLVENSNEIIYKLNAAGQITYISPAVKQLGGYDPEELIGRTSLEFVHPDDLPGITESFQRTVAGRPEPSEYRLRKKSGEYLWVQTASKLIYEGDEVAGLRGLIVDIDQRKRAEMALSASEDRYRELFEKASDLVYAHDITGRFTSMNHAIMRVAGYTVEEALKLNAGDLVAPDCHAVAAEMAQEAFQTGMPATCELDIIAKDGSRVTMEVSARVLEEDGVIVGVQGIARDISDRKRLEASRAGERRVLEAIASGASLSDVLTLLTAVVEEQADGVLCSVLLADGDGKSLRMGVAPSLPDGYNSHVAGGIPIGPDMGSCGTAAYRKELVVVSDIADDPLWAAGREVALEHGLRACWSLPIFSTRGDVLGTFAMYYDAPRTPAKEDIELIERATHIAGIAIERKQAEEALHASEERYRNLVDTAQDVIFTLAPDATFMSLNPAFETVTGWKREDWLGKSFAPVVHPEDLNSSFDLFKRCLAGEIVSYELRIRKPSGDYLIGEFTSTPLIEGGVLKGTFGIARDITERKKAEAMIRELAYHDGLTGLPNRTLFEDRLNVALAQAHRSHQRLAVMFLDLDRFKVVNDTLGHGGGDKLLKGVAQDLKTIVREGDTVARVGGDEFTLLLPGIESQEDATEIAQRVLDVLRGPRLVDGKEFSVTTSIGLTVYPEDGADTDTLLRNADTAMYRAKERGRDNFQLYTPAMNAAVLQRLSLEADLRHALERDELRLFYQPIADTVTEQIVATEALVRWEHPERGIVEPDEFIAFAEETGLIVPIGEWVLKEAMLQNRIWQKAGRTHLRVGVNLSARQLQQEDMVSTISRLLRETGLAPEFLQLEITEGAVMKNVDPIIAMLYQIRRMGIGISLDDFGTGYSSLSYLKRFPIDSVKVDRSFVRDIATDPNDAAIVTTVIAMARSLNLRVIAEGVETSDQLEFLRERGCDQFQGYLVSEPGPPEAIGRLLEPVRRRAKTTRVRSA
jgi:diguanylate cyclase (GGDEF)-like protein/PAS domain S-box-containing protein